MNDDMIPMSDDPETRTLQFELIEAEREVRRINLRLEEGQSEIQSYISTAIEDPDAGIGPIELEADGKVYVSSGDWGTRFALEIASKTDLIEIITYSNSDEDTSGFDESIPDFIEKLQAWIDKELFGGYILTTRDYAEIKVRYLK
ncbi:hypothetical protein Gdia_0552 [Gluconacetobacter diazotrophicus PA1 5]|uniref:hypothetical protein n=1 Tax=Gluconacetobacter diazotrophicus TaxID=33996 RepID=UPI000173B3F9|nr:hypothetical protein [Gluconacetobacter diazotrophicus]ACI50346.1 hypothetical protein Gdia_0552 [Gluconacetobacter diazotrophicus PA1 5]